MEACAVTVEADCSSGLPSFDIVGLATLAVKESARRVRSAYTNAIGEMKKGRITVNLAPADLEKQSSAFDLPVFVSICGAFGNISAVPEDTAFVGEISLSGVIRAVDGIIAYAAAAADCDIKRLIVPLDNADEAALIPNMEIIGVPDVKTLISYLNGETQIAPAQHKKADEAAVPMPDFCEVKGHYLAKRALEIAAAGGHNVILIGPPGSGKSMMAKRLPSILPPLSDVEAIEVTKIWSVAGIADGKIIYRPPFRSPHHTTSAVALAGGGKYPRPGEISLAHRGVLFFDECPEFAKSAIEVLRQPLEDKKITVSRAAQTCTFPADFMLVCAANPCRCGNFGSDRPCSCTTKEKKSYMSHISGPMIDRMDMFVEVPAVKLEDIKSRDEGEKSADILKRVTSAREKQAKRLAPYGKKLNAQMEHPEIEKTVKLTDEARALLDQAYITYKMTARSNDRLLRLAQTIADIDGKDIVGAEVIAEALGYRTAEKKYFSKE